MRVLLWVARESFELCELAPNGKINRFFLQDLFAKSLPKEGAISCFCDGRITHKKRSKYIFVGGGGCDCIQITTFLFR